jgi:hypothetical protein
MKIYLVLVFCLIVVLVNCAPQSQTADSGSTVDEIAKEKLNSIFDDFRHSIEKQNGPLKLLASVVLHSVDKSCVLDHYKNHGLIDKVPSPKALGKADANIMILAGFAKACSTKTDIFIEFVFEAFMSTHSLLKAFIYEPEFKESADMLLCATSYAVKNKYLDPQVYKINYTLPETAGAECNMLIEKVEKEITHAQTEFQQIMSVECVKEVFEDAKNILLKYAVLVQVDLTGEQKKELRDKFVKEVRENDEKLVLCIEKFVKTGKV